MLSFQSKSSHRMSTKLIVFKHLSLYQHAGTVHQNERSALAPKFVKRPCYLHPVLSRQKTKEKNQWTNTSWVNKKITTPKKSHSCQNYKRQYCPQALKIFSKQVSISPITHLIRDPNE